MNDTDVTEQIEHNRVIVNDINEDAVNMNDEQQTNQVKDATVSEYLNGIRTFIDNMKTLPQVGGGNSTVANERSKVAKLFDVLSIEELLSQLQKNE